MPQLLTNPAHWHLRALEARGMSKKLQDPEARAAKLEMARKYERLAARATEWMNKTEDIPRFLSPHPPSPELLPMEGYAMWIDAAGFQKSLAALPLTTCQAGENSACRWFEDGPDADPQDGQCRSR